MQAACSVLLVCLVGTVAAEAIYLQKEQLPPWGTIQTTSEREPTCAELRSMWRHTRRIIRHAAEHNNLNELPAFVNSVEYAFAPKFLQFWHAKPKNKPSLPFGRLLTKSKTKRPPPSTLGNTKYQILPRTDKVTRTAGIGMGYFHEDDEGGDLVFQDPAGEAAMPKEEDFGLYGTVVRSPEEKAKLRREFLLSGASRFNKGIANFDPYKVKSKYEICREKVENAPCRNDLDCFCSKSVHPYTCHETLGVCTRKGGMQVLRDNYGRWFPRPFEARELGKSEAVNPATANEIP